MDTDPALKDLKDGTFQALLAGWAYMEITEWKQGHDCPHCCVHGHGCPGMLLASWWASAWVAALIIHAVNENQNGFANYADLAEWLRICPLAANV